MFLLALPYLGQWYADVNKKITRWSRNDDGLSNGKGGRGRGARGGRGWEENPWNEVVLVGSKTFPTSHADV